MEPLKRRKFLGLTAGGIAALVAYGMVDRPDQAMIPPKGFGWIRDLPDQRDLRLLGLFRGQDLPPKVDLRPECPPVCDQGPLQSCTATVLASALRVARKRNGLPFEFMPSRLFIYYNSRKSAGLLGIDAGAYLRDGMKSVVFQGYCEEKLWDYDLAKVNTEPPDECYNAAKEHKALVYMRLPQIINHLKACLSGRDFVKGNPFIFGFSAYESFESKEVAQTGKLSLPDKEEKLLGGHAVLAVGYDDAEQRFLVQNSWGKGWGMGGYFTIPYEYLARDDLSADFWTIQIASF